MWESLCIVIYAYFLYLLKIFLRATRWIHLILLLLKGKLIVRDVTWICMLLFEFKIISLVWLIGTSFPILYEFRPDCRFCIWFLFLVFGCLNFGFWFPILALLHSLLRKFCFVTWMCYLWCKWDTRLIDSA